MCLRGNLSTETNAATFGSTFVCAVLLRWVKTTLPFRRSIEAQKRAKQKALEEMNMEKEKKPTAAELEEIREVWMVEATHHLFNRIQSENTPQHYVHFNQKLAID